MTTTSIYEIDGHVITIRAEHDGQVPAYNQRNGSGSYNAKRYTKWVVVVDGKLFGEIHSKFGYTKWQGYEWARQSVARTADAVWTRDGYTRYASIVKAEMTVSKIGQE